MAKHDDPWVCPLSNPATKTVLRFQVAFAPQINFVGVLSSVAPKLLQESGLNNWQSDAQYIMLREDNTSIFYFIRHNVAIVQTMGYAAWDDNRERSLKLMELALAAFEQQPTELRMSSWSYIDLRMSAAEIINLMEGCFLPNKQMLPKAVSNYSDASVELINENDDVKTEAWITAMTSEQIEVNFSTIPNMDFFAGKRKVDTPKIDFLRSIEGERLALKVVITLKTVNEHTIRSGASLAEKTTHELTQQTINTILSMP